MAQATKGALNTVAMILAFLAIGGFLYWLSIVSEPTEIVVPEEEIAQAVSLAAFAQNQMVYSTDNALIRVDGVQVQGLLGSDGFLFAFPDSSVYLVRLDPSMMAMGGPIEVGSQGSVTGHVKILTDSIASAWAADSIFAGDEEREAATASGTFLLATEVDLMAAGMSETGADSAQAGGQ